MYIFVEKHNPDEIIGSYLLDIKTSGPSDDLAITRCASKFYYIVNYKAAQNALIERNFDLIPQYSNIYRTGDEFRHSGKFMVDITNLYDMVRAIAQCNGKINLAPKRKLFDPELLKKDDRILVFSNGACFTIYDTIDKENPVVPGDFAMLYIVHQLFDVINQFNYRNEGMKYLNKSNIAADRMQQIQIINLQKAYESNATKEDAEARLLYRTYQEHLNF